MLIAIVIAAAAGFAAGRVHHVSSLKAKIVKLAAEAKAEEQAVIARVKSLVKIF